jgi:hypothetical protein
MDLETVVMPKWMWALICGAVLGATVHTVQLSVNTGRLSDVKEAMQKQQSQIDVLAKITADRGPVISEVSNIGADVDSIRKMLTEVRDDVLLLKAQREVSAVR